jgi:hypothetical protein
MGQAPDNLPLDLCIQATSKLATEDPRSHSLGLSPVDGSMVVRHVDPYFDQWEPLFRWVMNVVIYATNAGVRQEVWRNQEASRLRDTISNTPRGKKRERLQERFRGMDKSRRIVLGPGVKLEVLDGGVGKSPTVRVRVQGHWKRQVFGPARANRKIIWIEPYWRGPDDPEPPVTSSSKACPRETQR